MRYPSLMLLAVLGEAITLLSCPVKGNAQGRTHVADSEPVQVPTQRVSATKAQRRVTLQFDNAPLERVLRSITEQSGIDITYFKDVVVGKTVTVHVDTMTVYNALKFVLDGTGLAANVLPSGNVSVVMVDVGKEKQATGVVTGSIVDSAAKKGIAKVTVTIVGTKISTITNDAGQFVLRGIEPGKHIVDAKLFGYRSGTTPVDVNGGQETKVRIILAPVATSLSEVVTTATGMQRRVEVGNDVTTIDVQKVIQTNPVSSVTDLLATRVPGLLIGKASGQPGAKTEIRMRGTNSIRASMEPIVIVDGVQVIGDLAGIDPTGFATSPIDQLDVNSIDKIEVHTGPSAVALYGSNAANGVIVITTKRGRAGPPRWNAVVTVAQETLPGKWPVNYFAWGEDLVTGLGTVHCPREDLGGAIQNWGSVSSCRYDSTTVYQILNNPQTTVFGRGIRKLVSMGVSGGTNQISYSVTGSFAPTLGLLKVPDADVQVLKNAGIQLKRWQRRPDALDQYNGTAKITIAIGDRSDLTYTTTFIREDKRTTPLVSLLGTSGNMKPPLTLYDQNGDPVGVGSGALIAVGDFMAGTNRNSLRFLNSANYKTTLWNTLILEARAGVDVKSERETYLLQTGDYCPLSGSLEIAFGVCSGRGEKAIDYRSTRFSKFVTDAHFTASGTPRGLQWLKVTPVVGIDVNSDIAGSTGVAAGQLPVGGRGIQGAEYFGAPTDAQIARRTAGMFAQATVNIADQMWLPFSVRTDAANAIGAKDRTIFPRVQFSYLMSDGPKFRSFPIIGQLPELRFRAAFGVAGRQPGLADKYRTYTFSQFPIDNVNADIANVYSVGNSHLSPEISRDWQLGVDGIMIDNHRSRWEWKFTFVQTHTSDLLMDESLPPSLGSTTRRVNNIGDAERTDIDITITGFQRLGKIGWNMENFFSTGKGRLLSLAANMRKNVGVGTNKTSTTQYRVGYPIDGRWALPVLGFVDSDGDGYVRRDEVIYGDSLRYLGSATPQYTLSSSHTINIMSRLTIAAILKYEAGGSVSSADGSVGKDYSQEMNDPNMPLDDQVKYLYDVFWKAHRVSTLTLNSLQVTYNLQLGSGARFLGARSVQVAVSGTNLGLWSTFSGLDPTVGGILRKADRSVLPTPRTYGISVRVQ